MASLALLLALLELSAGSVRAPSYREHAPILIRDNQFTPENGVTGGRGTAADPYIIEGWDIGCAGAGCGIHILTSWAQFVIRNVYVHCTVCIGDSTGIQFATVSNGRVEASTIASTTSAIVVTDSLYGRSSDIIIQGNTVTSNGYYGIFVSSSSRVSVNKNNITRSSLFISYSDNVSVSDNTFSSSPIFVWRSSYTSIFHNSFLNSTYQGYDPQGVAIRWDDGYPSGGNYWSAYHGVDHCRGPTQTDCTGPDGIGDTPYDVSSTSQDRYPLMNPPTPADTSSPTVAISSPNNGATTPAGNLTVAGTAADAGGSGVDRVEVRFNGGPWRMANGTSSWTFVAQVALGTYDIEAQAWDRAGNPSSLASVTITVRTPQYTPLGRIFIYGNDGFTGANGVTGGRGTPTDPYVIEGWDINASHGDAITIKDTTAPFVIRNVQVHSGIITSPYYATYQGIVLDRVSNGRLENVSSWDIGWDMVLKASTATTVVDSNLMGYGLMASDSRAVVITGDRLNGILMRGDSGVALRLSHIPNNRIPGVGISISGSTNVALAGNDIYIGLDRTGLGYSTFRVESSNHVTIASNRMTVNGGVLTVHGSANVTAEGNDISLHRPLDTGLAIQASRNVTVKGNTVASATPHFTGDSRTGLHLSLSDLLTVRENHFDGLDYGVSLDSSTRVTLEANTFNRSGVSIRGSSPAHFSSHRISPTNSVNGKPLYYYKDQDGLTISETPMGQLLVVNSSHIAVADLRVENTTTAIELAFVSNASLRGNVLRGDTLGIYLAASNGVTITANNVRQDWMGIASVDSSLVIIKENNATDNQGPGIYSGGRSRRVIVFNNVATRNWAGISAGSDTTVVANFVSNNRFGIVASANSTLIYHNTLVDNGVQAYDYPGAGLCTALVYDRDTDEYQCVQFSWDNATWDNGYPDGGNYWSDGARTDLCSGPRQDLCNGPDGIVDVPYSLEIGKRDRYPLAAPAFVLRLAPVAAFEVSPSNGTPATVFQVDATASMDPDGTPAALQVRWDWEGDGLRDTGWSTDKLAQHQYAAPGIYNMTLEVIDPDGLTDITARRVMVFSQPLHVSISARPRVLAEPLTVSFVSRVTGGVGPYLYAWDFGEGGAAQDPNPSHTFPYAGTFTVILKVSDANGGTTVASLQIFVPQHPVTPRARRAEGGRTMAGVPAATAPAAVGLYLMALPF